MSRLGAVLADRYRIERELGAGGMATVYLAEDLKHDRKVAIKVLKPELAAVLGAERFVTEIKTTAALQHPNILPLFDSGEAGGFLFYVMPYVEGETLRTKLDRETQLGVDESVKLVSEVADALQYAHEHGVVHRDIKPENILLHAGRPMVADFGIALAVSAAAGGRMTETGLSLGTPHYMSPEQATAEKTITARSDVYSLASVLYEMLSGQPPHLGGSAQQIIMKIIAEPVVEVTSLRKAVPPNVAAALAKALEKLPADRFESASAFAQSLANPHFATEVAGAGAVARVRRGPVVGLVSLAAVFAILAAAGWLRKPVEPDRPLAVFTIDAHTLVNGVEVSPDGSKVLFVSPWGGGIRIRSLDRDSVASLTYTVPRGRISPENRRLVGVLSNGDLIIADLPNGAPKVIATLSPTAFAIWGRDGFVYFTLASGLGRMRADGGTIDTLLAGQDNGWVYRPMDALPDGKTLLVTRARGDADTVALFDLARRTTTPLLTALNVSSVRYAPPGYLVYNDENRLLARPFDLRRRTVGARSITIAEGPGQRILGFGLGGNTLAYATFGGGVGTLVIAGRQDPPSVLPNLPPGDYNVPIVSPDGRRIAVRRIAPTSDVDLWVYQLPAGPLSPLTRTGDAGRAIWLGNGARIAYTRSGKPGDIFWRRSDGSGDEHLLLHRDDMRNLDFFADGQRFVYTTQDSLVRVGDVSAPDRDKTAFRIRVGNGLSVSPDGRWLAYGMASGGPQVYVQPLSGAGARVQVSVRSGVAPRWSHDGRGLYFLDGADLMEAMLEVGEAGIRVKSLARLPFYDQTGATLDIFPDDNRIVMTRSTDESGIRPGEVTVVTDFDMLLRQLARSAK